MLSEFRSFCSNLRNELSYLKLVPNVVTKVGGGMEDLRSEKTRLDGIRAEREYLIEQIRLTERTIKRSRELIKQLDEMLAKDRLKP